MFLRLFIVYILLFIAEIAAIMIFPNRVGFVLVISLILNVFFIFRFMNYGYQKLRENHRMERLFFLVYGIICYLCLIFQLAVLFYIFYLTLNGAGVIPKEVMEGLDKLQNAANDEKVFQAYISPMFTYVFPGFYKFPSNGSIYSIMQYYVGKFIDLFILAYIVEAIRKSTGLK